jgi:hypothetical protein
MRNGIARKLGLPDATPENPTEDEADLVIDLDGEFFEGGLYWGTFGRETAGEEGACECISLSPGISSMSLHLEFDFDEGTVGGWIRDGTLSYTGEDGLEFADGSFDATLGGTITPTQDGSWEFHGTAKLGLQVEGRMICGRINWEDDVEYVHAEGGAEVPGATATFSGGSETQMAVGGGQFFLTWRDDETLDCQGGPSMEFEVFNPHSMPFPYEFPPVPGD